MAERLTLNILSRLSGIATTAHRCVEVIHDFHWHGQVAGTRKTTPGFRIFEKYALIVGGVATHRMDISQLVMLKDNHIMSCGSITNAVLKAKVVAGFSTQIEVKPLCKCKLFVY
jgi:nicotinate-nucleotide pyrophosphorylase (carboxylating)